MPSPCPRPGGVYLPGEGIEFRGVDGLAVAFRAAEPSTTGGRHIVGQIFVKEFSM